MPAHRTFPSRTPWLTPGSARATAHRVRTRLRLSGTHADDGFTMIEVVVALTLFVIFSAAATMAVVNGVDAQAQTQGRVAAANIAQADLEQARSQATPASTSYATTPPGST
ncbi:MAG: type II secretion system protein, partial [Actinobacteria bacterium]|nr:type II secretion system protein [Actinomycetota bacterium]